MKSLSVLIVDDVDAFARLLVDGLREAGHAAVSATSSSDATALLSRIRFDVLVTDIIMPGRNGFELIDEVKRIQPTLRVVAMSGGGNLYSADACLQAAAQSGVDAVLQKPFGAQQLTDALRRLFPESSSR